MPEILCRAAITAGFSPASGATLKISAASRNSMQLPSDGDLTALAGKLGPKGFAALIDHTNLSATARRKDIELLCQEAREMGAASVCINGDDVLLARKVLENSAVRICTVIGFPLGADTPHVKVKQAEDAFMNGAHEVDMVIDISSALERDFEDVRNEIRMVLAVRDRVNMLAQDPRLVKVIIETCYLQEKELIQEACRIAKQEHADFVKSSTGFGQPQAGIPKGATFEFISWMRDAVGPYHARNPIGVKASGGIGDARTALQMLLAAGILDSKGQLNGDTARVVRIGASKGPDILKDFAERYVKGGAGSATLSDY